MNALGAATLGPPHGHSARPCSRSSSPGSHSCSSSMVAASNAQHQALTESTRDHWACLRGSSRLHAAPDVRLASEPAPARLLWLFLQSGCSSLLSTPHLAASHPRLSSPSSSPRSSAVRLSLSTLADPSPRYLHSEV